MKRSLFLQYADGREDIYPFLEGQSTLGSDPSCEYGIQADGIAARHVVFSTDQSGTFAVNLQDAETVKLNGSPLDGRRAFEIGDELEIGSVRVRIQPVAAAGENLADTPDGVAAVAASARRDAQSGWRGYRKILEKLAPFISPIEAETAERLHRSGHRALVGCLLGLIALMLAAWGLEARHWFLPAEICRCAISYLSLLFTLVLTVRYRIRCAGRVFALLNVLDLLQAPPSQSWVEYFGSGGIGTTILFLLPILYLFGWGFDAGAGCLFSERRSHFVCRFLLLLLCVGMECALSFLAKSLSGEKTPLNPVFYLPLLAMAGLFPIWGRFAPRKWAENELDIAFVSEQAAWRMWRRWLAHALTILAVGTPLLYLLCALGLGERVIWQMRDELVVSTEDGEAPQAWYWTDRGRYLQKSDFETELIYRVPFSVLLAVTEASLENGDAVAKNEEYCVDPTQDVNLEAIESIRSDIWKHSHKYRFCVNNGIDPTDDAAISAFLGSEDGHKAWEASLQGDVNPVLGYFGEDLCRKIASVQLDATNAATFADLRTTLAPYRAAVPKGQDSSELHLGKSDSLFFYLNEVDNRETYSSGADAKLHHAQVNIEVWSLTQDKARRMVVNIGALVIPCLIWLVLGGLLLWKRGTDSPVGFWMGIALVINVLLLLDSIGIEGGDFGKMLQYPLWRWATESPVGSLIAGGVDVLRTFGYFLAPLALFAQSVLFVLLCWPRPATARKSRWLRFLSFSGKVVLAFGVGATTGIIVRIVWEWITKMEISPIIVPRIAAIIVLGIFGAWLRRKRRFDTEAPELGWMFFASWLLLELAQFPMEAEMNSFVPNSWLEPISHILGNTSLAGVIAVTMAAMGCILFLRLCLKRNFLSVLTADGITFAMFSLSVPVLAEIVNPLVGKIFEGSFLQSERGEHIVTIAVIVLVMRPLWNLLGKISRRLSVRNLVRVESGINQTLENVFDQTDPVDIRDEIFSRLGELGVERYAFFVRSSADSFELILKNGWNSGGADSFRMSPYLRHFLGCNPHVVDLNSLAQDDSLFFQSFELLLIGKRIHAGCLLPICLGQSVRGILVTPDCRDGHPLSNTDAFLENVNTLGLATVETLVHAPPTKMPTEE